MQKQPNTTTKRLPNRKDFVEVKKLLIDWQTNYRKKTNKKMRFTDMLEILNQHAHDMSDKLDILFYDEQTVANEYEDRIRNALNYLLVNQQINWFTVNMANSLTPVNKKLNPVEVDGTYLVHLKNNEVSFKWKKEDIKNVLNRIDDAIDAFKEAELEAQA